MAEKWGGSKFYTHLNFLGINPITLMNNSGQFIGLARALNSKTVTYSLTWTKAFCSKAQKLGMKVEFHIPHEGIVIICICFQAERKIQ